MKRYAVISDPEPYGSTHDNLEDAIQSAKDYVIEDRETFYVVEIVGAVHPGKPRWRPTERKEKNARNTRYEWCVDDAKKLF